MARSDWIVPRADAACGKAFLPDRRAAEGHRVALEFWMQATGQARVGYHLVVFRCKQCCGFHVGRKKLDQNLRPSASAAPSGTSYTDWALLNLIDDVEPEDSATTDDPHF
jgi:hypothetical protein